MIADEDYSSCVYEKLGVAPIRYETEIYFGRFCLPTKDQIGDLYTTFLENITAKYGSVSDLSQYVSDLVNVW